MKYYEDKYGLHVYRLELTSGRIRGTAYSLPMTWNTF